jgi:hypothetical protein
MPASSHCAETQPKNPTSILFEQFPRRDSIHSRFVRRSGWPRANREYPSGAALAARLLMRAAIAAASLAAGRGIDSDHGEERFCLGPAQNSTATIASVIDRLSVGRRSRLPLGIAPTHSEPAIPSVAKRSSARSRCWRLPGRRSDRVSEAGRRTKAIPGTAATGPSSLRIRQVDSRGSLRL